VIAFLGMYDPPALRASNDRYWQAIRARLGWGPEALTRGDDPWAFWRAPDLVLAQTCGMPFRTALHGQVALVGTPDYGLPGCPPGHYRSVFVTRTAARDRTLADLATGVFAYNEALSQSGWAAPMHHLAERGLRPARLVRTGSHAASARAVASGRADLAALDALSWALLQDHDPVAANLVEIDRTEPTPGLPYITARGRDAAAIAAAITAALGDLDAPDRAALHLNGLVAIPAEAYLAIPTPPGP
jgi:ABC-type phosphate/phosphonate transport system substrate-binding protein